MKYHLFILLFIAFFGNLFSQHLKIPKFDFTAETENINPYIELLNIKDEQALIIKIGSSNYRSDGLQNDFLVFQNNGKISFYEYFFHTKTIKKESKNDEFLNLKENFIGIF